ncbi:RNAPII degradation factor, partial [Coemansia brasiliensis]
MSMASSNTQQASTRGGKGTRGNSRQSADDEAVSARALKTLKELFSDWTEEDLKSAFRDSNNDLDKTIDYISEAMEATETVSEIVVEETKIEDGSVKVEETVVAETVHAQPEPSVDQAPSEPEKTAQPTHAEEIPAISSPKKPASSTRRLHQDAPVVMPSGKSTLERIGVQFGSLSIGGVELGAISEAGASAAPEQPKKEPSAPQAEAQKAAPAVAASKIDAAPTAASATEPTSQQGPLTTYLQQQQQQQQQQQAHSTANTASISQMPLPNDYGAAALYGAEAQRNMMGFYDNYGYGQFVANKDTAAASSVSEAQPSTSAPQAASANGSTNLSQAGLFPQMPQPFGMNHGIPYYPYYYNMMQPGSQYHNPAFGNNPALAAAYGQPFMKQGMYPMYPGATPQGLQGVGSQQPQQPSQQATQQPNLAQQQSAQQQAGVQQPPQQGQAAQQASAQQAGVKGSAQNSAASYGNINAQKVGNPYGHYAANIASGFGMYEQDPALSSPQQFGLAGIPGILSASKGAGGKDTGSKSIHPAGTAPVVGGTTYYNAPQQQQQPQQQQAQQQLGGYPSQQSSNTHPQGFSHQQQAYYNPYMNYSQNQSAPH